MLGGAALIFLLFAMGGSAAAYAQTDGTFNAATAGFEMRFPSGWNSTSISENSAVVSAPGVGPDAIAGAVMTVLVVDRLETRKLITSEVGLNSGRVMIHEDETCKSLVDELVSLNGNRVFHTIHECSGETYNKSDTYVIFTLTKSVAVSLDATSEEAYGRHIEEFEGSLETITVSEPIDFRVALEVILGATNIFTQNVTLDSANSHVKLTAATSSRISSMVFNEQSKTISITLEELRRSEGHLLIPAHRLLVGPYQVYINGEASEDFVVIGDGSDTTQLIDVRYGKGANEIDIVGTRVVPEFGAGITIAVVAAMSAAIAYLRRTNRAF